MLWSRSRWGGVGVVGVESESEEEERTIHIKRPHGALMPVVRAQSFPIIREPDVDDMVLGAGEEEIALLVELDLRERTLVA